MLITPEEALRIVLDRARPLEAAGKPLSEALGCYLAERVCADRDMPPTDRSAMDGYAVVAGDLSQCPCDLQLTGEVAAGGGELPRVERGACVRILTGAVVPPGADTVVKVEQTRAGGDAVTFLEAPQLGENIRRQGEEVRQGQTILEEGAALGPAQIGLCASVGKATVRVHGRPRPAVLCTGEELREVDESVGAHQLRDSNGPALRAALAEAGHRGAGRQIVRDDLDLLAEKIEAAAIEHDVVIVTGGVSVGKYDFVPDAIKRLGAAVHFHGVGMKPGKPQLYATLDGGRHLFGLPGNPLSVLTGFYELVLPALRRMSGCPLGSCRPSLRLPLARAVRAKGTRVAFVLVQLICDDRGQHVEPVGSRGSADLASAANADGMIVIPKGVKEVPAGDLVEFRPWRPVP